MFDDTHGLRVQNLVWIAVSIESSQLKDMLLDISDSQTDWDELFPGMDDEDVKNGFIQEFISSADKFGFLAEVHIPRITDFTFKGKKPVSYSVIQGICVIHYLYAENLDELLEKLVHLSETNFNRVVDKALSVKKKIAIKG